MSVWDDIRGRHRITRQDMALTSDNPVRFLLVLLAMSRQADRAELAFDHEDLEWCADVWNHAAVAALGDPDMTHWAGFYRHHSDDLKNGEAEFGTMGMRWFDQASEWPPTRLIGRAIVALRTADMDVPGIARKPSLHRSTQ